ncbi:MAG: hypothetical protein MUC32_01680 [Burkholderiaceae bacterium]|nr:hypothetical protein [Burkholderiaceae bacterium]
MWKILVVAAAVATAGTAFAQDKKALVAKVLQLQQPGIESTARIVAEQPAMQMLQQAAMAIRARVPEDKREALARDIQADAKKYADEAVPLLRDSAVKLAPTTIGPILEREFNEAELKQLITILESPVNRKFQSLGGEMQRSLTEKLVAESKPAIEPKLRALQQSVGDRINAAAAAPGAPAQPGR